MAEEVVLPGHVPDSDEGQNELFRLSPVTRDVGTTSPNTVESATSDIVQEQDLTENLPAELTRVPSGKPSGNVLHDNEPSTTDVSLHNSPPETENGSAQNGTSNGVVTESFNWGMDPCTSDRSSEKGANAVRKKSTKRASSWFRRRSRSGSEGSAEDTFSISEGLPSPSSRARSPLAASKRGSVASSLASRSDSDHVPGSPTSSMRHSSGIGSLFGAVGSVGLPRKKAARSSTMGNLRAESKMESKEQDLEDHALEDAKTLNEALHITYKMSVLLPGGHLHRRIKRMERSMARESTVNILRSNRPLVCALSKRWFQTLLLLYCIGNCWIAISAVVRAATHTKQSFSAYRFTSLEQRAGQSNPMTAHVGKLGLLRDGCRVEAEPVVERREGAAVSIEFTEPQAMNGFYFQTAADDPDRDPLRFRLEGSDNAGAQDAVWEPVASSSFQALPSGHVVFTDERFDTPTARGETVRIRVRAKWPWFMGWGASQLFIALFMLLAAVLGALEMEKSGERTFQLGWFIGSIVRVATTIGFLSVEQWGDATYWALFSLGGMLVFWATFSAGRWFVRALVVVGCYLVGLELLAGALWFKYSTPWQNAIPFLGISMIFVGLCFKVLRLSIKWGARLHIQDDKRAFEEAWEGLAEDETVRFDLYRLEKSIQAQNMKIGYWLARHYNTLDENVGSSDDGKLRRGSMIRSRTSKSLVDPSTRSTASPNGGLRKSASEQQVKRSASVRGFFGLVKTQPRGRLLDFRNPVQSLDQLYTEAYGANIMLRAKVQEWALKSRGMFAVGLGKGDSFDMRKKRSTYALWDEIRKDPDMLGRVQWTKLKQVDRAIEKAMLCYNSDVSRVLDISRQRIVFDRVQDLEACFETIAADNEISLCRIKNYMGSGYVQKSSGFRAVIINMRICSSAAIDLGLDTHVCEVQLVTTPMVQLQTREQHANYIRFRNDLRVNRVREPLWHLIIKCMTWNWIKSHLHLPFHHHNAEKEATKTSQAKRKAALQTTSQTQNNRMLLDKADSFVLKKDGKTLTETQRKLTEMMVPAYKINSNTAGDELHTQIQIVNDAMQHANRIGVAFTSKAAAAMISKRLWQALLFLVATLALVWSVINTVKAFKPSYVSYKQYRFISLELRGGGQPEAHIASLGLLRDGCKVELDAVVERREGAAVSIEFTEPQAMNGFYFQTAADDPDRDPLRFRLEGRDEGGGWHTVGSSSWRIRAAGFVRFTDGEFATPQQRLERVDVYPRADWPWVVAFPGVQFVVLTISYTLVVCGAAGRARHAELLLMSGFSIVTILQVVSAAGETAHGRMADGVYWLFFAVAPLVMGVMIAVDERHIIARMTAAGAYLSLLDIVFASAVYRDMREFTQSPPLTGLLFFFAGSSLLAAHAMAMWRAKRLIQEDKAQYDAVWARDIADPQTKEEIDMLANKVNEMTKKLGKDWARQMSLKEAESLSVSLLAKYDKAYAQNAEGKYIGWSPHLSRQSAHRSFKLKRRHLLIKALTGKWKSDTPDMPDCPSVFIDVQSKIDSLDQLYMQAHCMDVVLKAKVQAWALLSEGMFPITRMNGKPCVEPTFSKWSDLKNQTNPPVKWAKVKSVSRSIEKLLRVYQADVSKLVDVCRQSIIFSRISDLAECFDVVVNDPEVEILRVVNRLDTHYDTTLSAGYRDVKLNIRVNTKESVELHINSHVCELQLIHVDFARLKHDAGHRRYKLFRCPTPPPPPPFLALPVSRLLPPKQKH